MEFNDVVEKRIEKIRATLASKAKEYAKGLSRFHNFDRAARILRVSPETALLGMFVKHLVSVIDIVESEEQPTIELLDEKIGDSINYLILLEGMYKEHSDDLVTITTAHIERKQLKKKAK